MPGPTEARTVWDRPGSRVGAREVDGFEAAVSLGAGEICGKALPATVGTDGLKTSLGVDDGKAGLTLDGGIETATGVADSCVGLPPTATGVRDSMTEDTVGTDTGEIGSEGEIVFENAARDGVGGPTLPLGSNDEYDGSAVGLEADGADALASGNVTEAMLEGRSGLGELEILSA